MRKLAILILTVFSVVAFVATRADDTRPWTFWYWMYGAVSKAGIKADLQGMKDVGLGGAYLMPIRGVQEDPEYGGTAQQLTDRFWEMTDYALHEADSLGLQMGIHVSDGFALAGGPWITPAESMQKIVFADTIINVQTSDVDFQVQTKGVNHQKQTIVLPRPQSYEGYYEDIACFAVPAKYDKINNATSVNADEIDSATPKVTCSPEVTRGDDGTFKATQPCWITYDYGKPMLCRNIEVVSQGNNIQSQRLSVWASDDDKQYRQVAQLTPPRQGWQNTGYHTTFALPPTKARYFRMKWNAEGTEPGSEDLDAAKWKPTLKVKAINLHGAPRLSQWEGKAGYVWRVAPNTTTEQVSDADCYQREEIIPLTLQGDQVKTSLTKGRWRILRIGHTSTGQTNATAGGGKGLECDKFSAEAVNKQIDGWFDLFMKRQNSHVIKYMHVDSWECGSQNWGSHFAAEFHHRRGYDLIPYLPVMMGIPMESVAKSEQVLRDVRITIDELVNEVFFATVKKRAEKYGVLLSSESVAPTMVGDGMTHDRYADLPMGEYWLNSVTHDKPNDMLDAVSGAHVYGHNIVQAEGFTEVRGVWNETPAMIKPLLDRNFCLGMNKLFFHVDTHNPWTDRRPGMTLDGIGLFFQRDQTWYHEASALVAYVARCQRLLQYGRPVVDIAVFTGEEMPRRAILPERLVNMLPGLFGEKRVRKEAERLANHGQPMVESPVGVNHSAHITDTKDWVNPLCGYAYDSMNKDALLRLAKVVDGHIVMPGGASYRVFVLPTARPMNPDNLPLSDEVKNKIETFRQAGVILPQLPYQKTDFSSYGLPRDVVLPENIAYTHRSGDDKDIYFLSNQTDSARSFTASFRQAGRIPYLYDAVTDDTISLTEVVKKWDSNPLMGREVDGRTDVHLTMPPTASIFVIFPVEKISPVMSQSTSNEQGLSAKGATMPKDLLLDNQKWNIRFEENNVEVNADTLFDWSKQSDPRIRYYSGHVMYATTFNYHGSNVGRKYLSFEQVYDLVHVWLNGKDCGIAWTTPYQLDITKALKKGHNEIRMEVVNTWANALRGADKGIPPFKGIWTNAKYRMKGDALLPAGIFGIKIKTNE